MGIVTYGSLAQAAGPMRPGDVDNDDGGCVVFPNGMPVDLVMRALSGIWPRAATEPTMQTDPVDGA